MAMIRDDDDNVDKDMENDEDADKDNEDADNWWVKKQTMSEQTMNE